MTRYYRCKSGGYHIDTLPGNPQVAVTHGFYVRADVRGSGLGHQLKSEQVSVLECSGFDYGICTVLEDNTAQRKIVEKNGYKMLDSFFDTRQGKSVCIYGRPIFEYV